jgi:hypothetical protein
MDKILIEGRDHDFTEAYITEEAVVWNMKYDTYHEWVGQPLHDDEKVVFMRVAR